MTAAWGPIRRVAIAFALVACAAASSPAQQQGPMKIADAALEPIAWSDVDGWASDDHAAAFATFLASCRPIVNGGKAEPDPRPMASAIKTVCGRAKIAGTLDSAKAGAFFEDNFRPVRVSKLDNPLGLLTGYYEPIVEGSRFPTPLFHAPIYRRPDDLVSLVAHSASEGFPNKGGVGRSVGDSIVTPYFDRAEIEDGALDGRHLEICWIKDPLDAMFIQIQGSARVRLEDGSLLRINYDSHNGFPFTPIGRFLIERNLVSRDEMSLDRIRNWMLANPGQAAEVRRSDRSFVFFRITGLGNQQEPAGGQGVRLTPGRSIAIDKALHVYGTPFFIEADLPIASDKSTVRFRRLMIAQDTGSAIVGPARADLYFGAGDEAGHVAGRVRHQGRFVMLVPREIDPEQAAAEMPLPRPRPRVTVTAKQEPEPAVNTEAATKAEPDTELRRRRRHMTHPLPHRRSRR